MTVNRGVVGKLTSCLCDSTVTSLFFSSPSSLRRLRAPRLKFRPSSRIAFLCEQTLRRSPQTA